MKLNSKLGNSKLVLGASLLGLTAVLSACGGDGGTNPPPATVVTVISGTVTPWTAGQTSTIAPAQNLRPTTTVDGSGNFDLPLPDIATMTSTYSGDLTDGAAFTSGCGNAVTITPGLKIGVIVDMAVGNIKPTYYTYASYQGDVLTYTGWWFSSADGTVTANNANCGVSAFVGKLTANVNLKAGWNIVNYTQTSNGGLAYQVSTAAPDNNRRTWRPNPIVSQSLSKLSRQANPWGFIN